MRRKRGLCLLLAASMALSSSFTALAADKKIDTVKLSFSYSKAPESGDEIGDITVKAGSSGFEVDSAEYTNIEDQDTWTVGDIPEVKVELSAKDGYKFSYTSKSHFSLSGCNADFKKAKIYDDGQYIEVYAELKRIGGKLQGASIEIIPKQGFYDYANKYQPGAALEVCPAEITPEEEARVRAAALRVYETLGLSVYSRADFILTEDGEPWFLEINTLPGMTPTSLLPQEAAAAGIDYNELCQRIVHASLEARKQGR